MLNHAAPVAYIRRSVARRGDPGDVSREFQTTKVRDLANGDGARLRIIDGDWGRSAATDKTNLRTAFLELLEDIERGAVSHVYAYSPDRLARSVEWSARLINACRRAGVPITTTAGTVAPDDPAARAMFNMLAVMNETALDEMERKAKASAATRRARGEVTGGRAYGETRTTRDGRVLGAGEDPIVVMAAFSDAGSYFGAARILNETKVPTRSGRPWYPRTVQRIVNRQDPSTKRRGRRGSKATSPMHRLTGLVYCHCGTLMGRTVSGEGTPRYRCSIGASDPKHSRPYIVSERALLPSVIEEAARFRIPGDPGDLVSLGEPDDVRRAVVVDQRRKLALAFTRGGLDDATYETEDTTLAAELADLDAMGELVEIPQRIDWAWPADQINTVLRTYWERMELDAMMAPVRFVWRLPAEYVV